MPEQPELAATVGTSSGKITRLGMALMAPNKKGQVGLYVATGNANDGCKKW